MSTIWSVCHEPSGSDVAGAIIRNWDWTKFSATVRFVEPTPTWRGNYLFKDAVHENRRIGASIGGRGDQAGRESPMTRTQNQQHYWVSGRIVVCAATEAERCYQHQINARTDQEGRRRVNSLELPQGRRMDLHTSCEILVDSEGLF